jgi:predicted neutral ceramidase superfamily lipid hydrolase
MLKIQHKETEGMSNLQTVENSLDNVFVKKAPELPKGGKDLLVEFVPWLCLIGGIFSLLSVVALWNWARSVNHLADYANSLSAAYGGGAAVSTSHWTVSVWLSLIVLGITAIMYILAFSPLKNHRKAGWNLLFYALLLNLAYGIIVAFTDYGGPSSLVGSLIGTAIGLYLLFQIRSRYSDKASASK